MYKYNFDEKINRKNTNSIKYDGLKRFFKTEDAKPLWVADMDFKTPDFIIDDIKKRLEHEILGYNELNDNSFIPILNWYKTRHNINNFEIKNIRYTTGVVTAISALVEAFSKKGDEVIVQTPVYYPFFSCVSKNNRKLILNPLKNDNNYYTIDFNDLKNKISSKTKILILCSPHNPVGRVWNKEELEKLFEICLKNNIIIVSDEIHSDIVFKKFTSALHLDEKYHNNFVVLNSASKTFNIAGLNCSYIICKNDTLIRKIDKTMTKRVVTSVNTFGIIAQNSAYKKGHNWLNQLLKYLESNISVTYNYIEKYNLPIKLQKPEATYLMWLDFNNLNLEHEKIKEKLLYKAKLALNDGSTFGSNGSKYFRLNIALTKEELLDSLSNLRKEFS